MKIKKIGFLATLFMAFLLFTGVSPHLTKAQSLEIHTIIATTYQPTEVVTTWPIVQRGNSGANVKTVQ